MTDHSNFCTCFRCQAVRREQRVKTALLNGWAPEKVAKYAELPVEVVKHMFPPTPSITS